MANDIFNKYATTPLTGFGPDPRYFFSPQALLSNSWDKLREDMAKRFDEMSNNAFNSADPTNLLKNLNSSNLSSSARKQTDSLESQLKKAEEERKKVEKERKAEEEKQKKKYEEDLKILSGNAKKTEQEIIKLENARVSAVKKVDREIETIEKRLEKTRGEVENINPNKVFALTNGESITVGVDKKEEERFKNKTAQIERDEKALEEKYKWREFVYSDDFTGKYIEDRNINYQNFLKKLGINNTSSPASQQEEMPDEIKEVINGTSQNGTTETKPKQKSTGKKQQSENVYDLTTEEGKARLLEDRKKEPKKQPSKLTEYEETHRDLVERSKADPNGVYILDINNPNFFVGGKKQHQAGDRLASNRIKDLPDGTVIAYKGSVRRLTAGDKVYGLDSITPKYDTPYEANTGNARSQKAQQDEIINSLPAITKQVEVDDKGYIIPDGDARSGTGTITEVEDSLSNYADIGSAEWEEMGDMERKDKAQEFLNYFGKRLLEAQKENPEVFTNEKIKQLLAEKKAQFDENIRLYLEENSDNLAEDVGNVARDLAISTINFFDEGMAGIADVFGMNTVAEFFYRGAEDISEFKSKEQKRKDKNYQYLKAKYEKQFGNGLIDGAKAAILAADESDNLLNTLRDSLVPSLLFMGGGAGALSKGSGFVAKNAAKISTVGVMGASGAGSAGADVRTIKDLALRDENSFNNFLEAYKKKNGEKAYNALIESATKNGKLDKEELFNILQSKAARIGGGLSATVGLISSSLGGDVETGLINRFVLGNAAARGAVGKLTALKLAGNIASSMANEGAEEAAETMSQNIALKYTADPERKITEGVGEATALGMAGGVIGGTLEYMGDRSANRNQQQNQQIQNQNQQADEFEVEDNPPQLTEREQLEQLNDPNMPVQEETEQKEQEEEQKKIEEQKKLEQKEEEKKEERLRKQYKRLFEPKGSFEEWLKDAEETIDTERQVKAMVDNLTDAQVREEIQWLFDNYIDNEEVLGHLSEYERKQFNEMLKTQFGLNTNPFVIVSEPTEAEKFWTTNENPSGVSPDIINAMAVDDGVAQNLNINADDEAYFQHMANVLNNTLVNNEEWNKATNTNERRAVLQKALDAELKDAQDIDEDKKNEIRLILSGELLANGAREFDSQIEQEEQSQEQTQQTEQQQQQQQQQEETPKQEKSDGRKQQNQPQSDTISIDIEDAITFDGVSLRRVKEIRSAANNLSINADEIQNRLDAGETKQNIVDDLLNSLNLTDKDEISYARNLLDRKVQDVLPKKKSDGKKQENKQTKSDGVKQTEGEFTAEDVANHSSEALTAYRQSGLPKAGKAIKDNTIAKYLNMSDEEASEKLNKQYGKKRGAERKALLDQIKEEIRSKKNGQQTNATENTGQSEETGGERTGEEEQRGSGLVNDEQGTTGDVSAESIGDTSQGQGSTESNQTDTSTETANSTGGTTDQTGQGENTLNEGASSEIENDNRQAESEGDTDKKSKGRKSTKSTNTTTEKNTTGGRKSRIEETERNTNDRGGETVAEEVEKTARQQLNDLGFADNEIHNLTADLTGTLNEDEVKKAARKKGIRAKKKLDEIVELFNQDIRDRIDDGEIKFSLNNQQETQNENDATLRNDEQQGDLGGNQSAETRAENDNQENSTKSNDTTPNEPTRNGNGKTRQRKAQKQKIIKSITGFNGEINDNQSSADPAELKASIENELRNTFGEETAGQVQVMTLEELRKTQPKTADSVEKYNVRGFYKPKSGQVVIIADHFAGLSPKEASLVAFHELGHKTMGAKRAEWDNELARLSSNKTISKIKNKLKQIEGYKNLNDVELTEEVMADLFAANQSGDWNSFADKYGVEFSKDLTGETRTLYERFKDFIKNFFGYGENEQVSDREVQAALGKLSLEFNGETEADLNSQEKSIAEVNSYIEQVRNGQAQDERISALVEQGLSDEDIVKDLFGELADADAEGKTYKTNLPENISNVIQNAWNGIKNTVSTVALGTATWVGTNLGMSQEAMAQDFNYSNPAEFESQVVRKIVDTNDHLGETFAVVNKQNGSLTIYDRNGNQIATTPALYGKKVGDTFNSTSSGTTPSGKFGLSYANDPATKAYGGSVIDLTQNGKYIQNKAGRYSIHRTYTAFPNERREARINSPTPADNKISLGCINVPPEFYDAHFENNQFGNMPLYVLPETPTGRTGIFSNQPSRKPATPKGKGDPSKGKPYSPSYMQYMGDNPFAAARGVETGEVKNAELEGLASTYKELNQINIGDSIAQDPTDRQDVLTTGFKDGLSSASMVTYNYGSEPDFNEETEDDPRLTPSERLANGYFDSMPIQRGVREDSTEDDDIYKASIGIVGGLEVALATKGIVNAVKTTQKRKSTGAKKLLSSQAPNQQYVDNRRKAWQNHIRKVSNDIDPETIDKKTGIGKNWTQARLDELADLYFNIDDFSDSLFDASSYKQSRTSDFDNHRTWGNNRFLRAIFRAFGGATPAFDNALGRQNIKRFGYEADSAIPSVHFARIKALTNGAMGHLQRSYLRPLHRQTEYLAQDLGKSTKQIRQDAGELATIDHILDEGADHFFRGLDLAIQEAKGKYGNLLLALQAAATAGNIRQYDKIDAQMKQLNEEIRKARIERVRSYRVYKGRDPDNGQTLLPGGFTEQMLNDKRTELQNNYGNDFSRLKKHSDEIVDITQKVRNFGATNGVFGADSLNTIQKLGFTNYVPLYTNPTENENLELDFDKSPFELLNELTQRTTNDILNLGVSSNVLKNILGNGTTRDFTSFGRSGSTSEKQALNAYENLETFAQKIAARTGTIPFAQSVQQLFEGTVGESMQTVNKNLNFAEFNSKQRVDANGNPLFDANGNPEMENMTMRGGNSKFKGLIRFPSDMSNDWKQPLTREEIKQLEQDLGMQPGKLGTPSQLKSRLASLQPIRGKGYNSDGELKNYDYYFIEPDVSNEINQSFNHLARTRLNDGGRLLTDILGAGTKLESKLMTSYNLVWNGVNFMRDSLERWSIMLNRPVKDSNGNLVSKWDLTKTYENNIAKLIGSPTEAMPEIYRYLTENEVKTELQRQLQEAVRGGGIQLMNDLLRKDSSILLDNKNEVIEKVLKHMEHWTNTGVNKIGGGGIRNTLKEINGSYIAAFVEIPQVISALAAYQTYQQLGVNKQESLNRTRDMFDPLRTRNNLISGASKWYPFVRATLSGHYNLIRTLTQYWKPGERGWMTGYLLGGTATAYAFYALAAGFMGDDDDGIPKIAKMSIQQLMQGIPIPAYKKGFFSIPTGFGINKIFSSLAAILFKYNHGQLSRGDAFKASLDLIFENTTPLKPVHSRDNSILGSMILTFIPYMFKTAAESYAGQRTNGSTLYKVQKKLGQKKHQIDDFTVPDKYKSLAKTLHDWSGGFLDFNPETLELFADNVFQGPLKVIPQNLMQDRAEKTLGHETSKGEFIGLALNLIGAGILSSPTAFEDYNFIHAFQRQRVGILETFNIDETGKTMMDEKGTLTTDAKAMGLDATQNVARRLAAKGASREVINFVVNNRNFTKIRNDLQRDLRHYLNIHNRHTDPKVRAMAKEQAEDLWNRIEGLQKFYIKNEGRSWYELLQEFNEGGLSREVLQSPY